MLHSHRFCRLRTNTQGTDYVVGDVHGQLSMLLALLDAVRFDRRKDRLISTGDLIDKGPDSEACINLLKAWPRFHAVLGNHEWMLREAYEGSERAQWLWEQNEGTWLDRADTARFDRLRQLVDGMPIAMEIPLRNGRRIGVIHAEVPRKWAWSEVRRLKPTSEFSRDYEAAYDWEHALWARSGATAAVSLSKQASGQTSNTDPIAVLYYERPLPGIDLVISGHTPLPKEQPLLLSNRLMIDTGAYRSDGKMTLVDPLNRRCWQVMNPATDPSLRVVEASYPEPLSFEPVRRVVLKAKFGSTLGS